MKIKIMTGFLLSISIILSQTIPSIISIPDFNGITLIIIILLNKRSYKKILIYGVFFGIISVFTTVSPNGQIPAFIDKIITTNIIYLLIKALNKFDKDIVVNIILFTGVFVGNMIYYILWFQINGMLIFNFRYEYMVLLEVIFLFVISAIVNTIIGKNIFKLVNKCIKYDKIYNDNN